MSAATADAVVIGGGAAGMLAAGTAAERGLSVILLEPNALLGRKLRITGKGRCNLTNDCDVRSFLENVPRGGRFLQSAVSRFTPRDAMAFFEELGVPLKTERGGRVFPVSDSAADVAGALERYLLKNGVTVRRERALSVKTEGGRVVGVKTRSGELRCASVIISTGGVSYPATGSDGSGYELARTLGHSVVPPRASLVPLASEDGFCAPLQGLSLKNVGLRALDDSGAELFSERGELLFTHFGVSGPLVLSASAHMVDKRGCRLSIDLKPALDEKTLDERLLRDLAKFANRDFKNSLGELAPRLLIPVLIERSGISPETKCNAVTRAQRRALLALFKDFTVSISGPRPLTEAIVTAGGVDTRELSPKTLGSKLVEGLHFAGEIIDADAYTGGYNLQIAWSTARAAGAAAERSTT